MDFSSLWLTFTGLSVLLLVTRKLWTQILVLCSIKMDQILALLIMEKLWSQILVLCSMDKELCTQILALPIMEKLWLQILVLYSRSSLDVVGLLVEVASSLQERKRS